MHKDIQHDKDFDYLLSCQPRVTLASCCVYKVIKELESIDHLFINPIHSTSDLSLRVWSSGVCKIMFYLTIVNRYYVTVTLGWHDSRAFIIEGKMTSFDSVNYNM